MNHLTMHSTPAMMIDVMTITTIIVVICRYLLADQNISMTSIEPDGAQAMYGSSHRHIVDTIQNVMRHVPQGSFDVAILNGIIGFGLDEDAAIEAAALAMHTALRPGGLAVLGYNGGMASCCHQFEPHFVATELGSLPPHHEMANSPMHHIYSFYRNRQ